MSRKGSLIITPIALKSKQEESDNAVEQKPAENPIVRRSSVSHVPSKKNIVTKVSSTSELSSEDEEGAGNVTLMTKAMTFGYHLPPAEAEIHRLEELHRTLHDKVVHRKHELPSTEVNLANWLDKHPEMSLKELNIADSKKTISAVMSDDALGMGRYTMRGDLREWLERIEDLNNHMHVDAKDWDSDDEREIDETVAVQMKSVLSRESIRRQKEITQITGKLANMLSFLAEREISIDSSSVTDEEGKLRQLLQHVTKWYDHVKVHGHPKREDSEKILRAPDQVEIKRRQMEQGMATAAYTQGLLLTSQQVDQVLEAFYQQQQPENRHIEKVRLERLLRECLVREENKTHGLRRTNKLLHERVAELEDTVERLNTKLAESSEQTRTDLRDPTTVEGMNVLTRTVAEVLAKKKVQDAQDQVDALLTRYNEMKKLYEASVEKGETLQNERDEMSAHLSELNGQWTKHQEQLKQQVDERKRLYGGQKDDKEQFINTMTTALTGTLSIVLQLFQLIVAQQLKYMQVVEFVKEQNGKQEKNKQYSSLENFESILKTKAGKYIDERKQAVTLINSWMDAIQPQCQLTDSLSYTLRDLRKVVNTHDEQSADLPPEKYCKQSFYTVDPERQLLESLARRMDLALNESRTKFREARFIRSVIRYIAVCFEAMVNGSYDDAVHGKNYKVASVAKVMRGTIPAGSEENNDDDGVFPPKAATAPDEDYNYAWSDELKELENCFLNLRHVLCDVGERTDATNAVLRALEVISEAQYAQSRKSLAGERTSIVSGGNEMEGSRNLPPSKDRVNNYGKFAPPSSVKNITGQQAKTLSVLTKMDDKLQGRGLEMIQIEKVNKDNIQKAIGRSSDHQDTRLLVTSGGAGVPSPGALQLAEVKKSVDHYKGIYSEDEKKAIVNMAAIDSRIGSFREPENSRPSRLKPLNIKK